MTLARCYRLSKAWINSFLSARWQKISSAWESIHSIEAAERAGVRYVVRSSAMRADENAITIGRWYREVEKALESSGLAYTILRPNAFMQNLLLSAESIKRGQRLLSTVGQCQGQLH
jgi:NAD(P)H-binding